MARTTFISYKYSDARNTRDRIIDALGDDAKFYRGEHEGSPDMTDKATETIKAALKDMIFGTSVTIVILSPNMCESEWIDWEVEYSLRKETRNERTSQMNGVVAVIQKVNGSYDWLKTHSTDCHGTSTVNYKMEKLPEIIRENHFNSEPPIVHCNKCNTYDYVNGSFIAFVEEDEFISKIGFYIENAFKKATQGDSVYDICRTK